jgi:PASTA domain
MEAWEDGGRPWERLARRYARWAEVPPDDADPLEALADLGAGRRLLDEAEMEAVRAARRSGRSWAEIATKLGVTRQSAWERWRDLDDAPEPEARGAGVLGRAARTVARRGRVTVPDVVGLTFAEARVALATVDLVGVAPDPDAPPDLLVDAVVVDQAPESGARAARGALVKLFTQRGGDSGVREPRRPGPTPLAGRKMRDEPTEEAVG